MATVSQPIQIPHGWSPAQLLSSFRSLPILSLLFGKAEFTRDLTALPSLPLFLAAKSTASKDPAKIAIIDKAKNLSFTYVQLLSDVSTLKRMLLEALHLDDLKEQRIAFLVPPGYDYVVAQWAIWAAGGVCVPLCMLS